MKITFIGGGNMASALVSGLIGAGEFSENDITVIEINAASRNKLHTELGVTVCEAPSREALAAEILLLAVKPQNVRDICPLLLPYLNGQLILSIAAGLRLTDLARWLNGYHKLIRAMPNTPALIGKGMSGLFANPEVSAVERAAATQILSAVGDTLWLREESVMDALTAISGSGPAYVFLFIEAMQHAAEQLGFSNEEAKKLVLATVNGAAKLATTSLESAAILRKKVTSEGGTTEAAIAHMLEENFIEIIQTGVNAAKKRGETLGDELARK